MVVAAVLVPLSAWPQGQPLGSEFRVNTYTPDNQNRSDVAADSAGNLVVVWNSRGDQDGSGYGIFGQRYAASGAPLGPEFRVNTFTTSFQTFPSVASDSAGNFVVVWSSIHDSSAYGVFGQRYASSGTPLGAEFRVNTYTTAVQIRPAVASDASGNFVIVWESDLQDGNSYGVFGQRYASSGAPLGPEFRVNTNTTYPQSHAAVASDPSGNFVVTWQGLDVPASFGTLGQRFASSGAPLGSEFRVNTYTPQSQYYSSVASDAFGNFVVVWQSYGQDGSVRGIFGQRFAASGTPLGQEFRVNTYTTSFQHRPCVASDAAGNFVVAWQSWQSVPLDGSGYGVIGQRYAGSGLPLGGEFRVNTTTNNTQNVPSVAADAAGNFVVAWQSYTQDGSAYGIYAQRFGPILPVELMRFSVE